MSRTSRRLSWGVFVGYAVLSGAAADAQAQPADQAAQPPPLEEIVVTAQKRAERLLDVPVSITAITGSDIESRGISDLQEAQNTVPGLTISNSSAGNGAIQLRGIGAAGGNQGLATVGIYLDEMPTNIGGGSGLDVRLLDMQRIEVLRGPQPTLYGEGSMGGTIHYVTTNPDLTQFKGYFTGNWGSIKDGDSTYRGEAVINAPLVEDKLGLRLVAGYEDVGGWIDSAFTGQKDVNEATIKTLRAKLLYKPTDALTISFLELYQENDQPWQNYGQKDSRITFSTVAQMNNQKYNLSNLVVSYNLGFATLLSTTGYLYNHVGDSFDLTSFYGPFLNPPPPAPPTINAVDYQAYSWFQMFTEEVRLTSNGNGPFQYNLGLYYRDPKTPIHQVTTTSPGSVPFLVLSADGYTESKGGAAFAELSYAFNDRLKASLGARYFEDRESQDQTVTSFGVVSAPGYESHRFTTFNPRIDISYKTSPDGLAYFDVAKGFRSGGFNFQAPGFPPTFGPEKLYTYELGTKQQLLDRRLVAEVAVYYNDWRDFQTQDIFQGLPITDNTGKASGPGVDLSLNARVTDGLTVGGTLGYVDMKYDTDSPTRQKGDPMDLVARWTDSVTADYRLPNSGGSAFIAHADYQHTSGFQFTLRGLVPPISRSDARHVVNLRAGLDFGQRASLHDLTTLVFVDNLTDDKGTLYPVVGSVIEPVLPRPRTIGVELHAEF